jgi:energy-coupling factor transporter ATP-binding protein EcfA2
MSPRIRDREREAITRALQAGVVPRIGLQHLQVGRKGEIGAVINDLNHIADGGAAVRFVIGPYGSGKTFFINLARTVAHNQNFVVTDADFAMNRRLYSTSGDARAMYAEMMNNISTKSKPTGGALKSIVERWISDIHYEVTSDGGEEDDVKKHIMESLESLRDFVGGYDFATVLAKYFEGFQSGQMQLQQDAIRWLRGEFSTKTEARKALGVRTIVDDSTIYSHMKLFAAFVREAGYAGLLVGLDEMGVMTHRIGHPRSREGNFEVILEIVNDCLQGNVSGLGVLIGGVPEFVEDSRRGLHSYGALKTRLAENSFAIEGIDDFSGPVIRLENLAPEDMYVLLQNIRDVFAQRDPDAHLITDDGIEAFMAYCSNKLGASYFQTPRDSVKEFVGLLSVLEQNPDKSWEVFLSTAGTSGEPASTDTEKASADDTDDDLVGFEL